MYCIVLYFVREFDPIEFIYAEADEEDGLRFRSSELESRKTRLDAFEMVEATSLAASMRLRSRKAGFFRTASPTETMKIWEKSTDHEGSLRLTFRTKNYRLLFLFGSLDDKDGPLRVLLGNLLCFDRMGKLLSELHRSQGNVIKTDVELGRSFHQPLLHQSGDLVTLRDQLGGVEEGYDGLEHFVDNGGQNTFVPIGAKGPVYLGELGLIRL